VQGESLSAYIHPSWHPRGQLVVCGSAAPMLHVWDVRYARTQAPQTLPLHEKRVLRCAFHPSDECLVTISSDNHLGFSTYRIGSA
jgi:WD40 repeat protein